MNAIEKLTKANAPKYFSVITDRAGETVEKFRQKVMAAGGPDTDILDYSPESLVPLWAWLYPKLTETDDKNIDASQAPPWYLVEIRNNPHRNTSLTSESLWWLDGLVYYFAEVFLRNLPDAKWSICNDAKAFHAYKPVMAGGNRGIINPVHNLFISCLQAIHKQPVNCHERLLNIYNIVKAEGEDSSQS